MKPIVFDVDIRRRRMAEALLALAVAALFVLFVSPAPIHAQTVPRASRGSSVAADRLDGGTFEGSGSVRWSLSRNGDLSINGSGQADIRVRWSGADLSESVRSILLENGSAVQPTSVDFRGFSRLSTASLKGFDMSAATDLHEAFYGDVSLTSIDVSDWVTSRVTNVEGMFGACRSLSSITGLDTWDTSGVVHMNNLFEGCAALTSLDVSSFDLSGLEGDSLGLGLRSMFADCTGLERLDASTWDVSGIANFDELFAGCSSLDLLDLSSWKTDAATSMFDIFYGCSSLSSLDLSGFDTRKVSNLGDYNVPRSKRTGIFTGCTTLSSVTLGAKWTFKGPIDNFLCKFPDSPASYGKQGKWAGPVGPNEELRGTQDLAINYDGATMAGTYVWPGDRCDYKVEYYRVKHDNEGGRGTSLGLTKTFQGVVGATVHVVTNPKSDEWIGFSGYGYAPRYRDEYGNVEVARGKVTAAGEPELTLKVYYTANHYLVHFDPNGASGGAMEDQWKYFDDGVPLNKNQFTLDDAHPFRGWDTFRNGGGLAFPDETTGNITGGVKNVTLYAQWSLSYGLVIHTRDEAGKPVPDVRFELDDEAGEPLDLSSCVLYSDHRRTVRLREWPFASQRTGKDKGSAAVYGLKQGTYYIKQLSTAAGYDSGTFDPASANRNDSDHQVLLRRIRVEVDDDGEVTVAGVTEDPDERNDINLTVTYRKNPDLPSAGLFGDGGLAGILQVVGGVLVAGVVACRLRIRWLEAKGASSR